jgi:hypothetical protein
MNSKRTMIWTLAGALTLLILLLAVTGVWAEPTQINSAAPSAPLAVFSNALSFQGRLLDSAGNPVDDSPMMTFRVYTQTEGGAPVCEDAYNVPVENGLFNAGLEIPPLLFDGQALWLGVHVEGDGQEMQPRQQLLPTPYALYAKSALWNGLVSVPSDLADGDDDTLYSAGTGLSLVGTQFSIALTYRLPQGCANGAIAKWNATSGTWDCGSDDVGGSAAAWLLGGNTGTTPGTDVLGTTDAASLTLVVNAVPALRLEPAYVPNLIGGYSGNSVTGGVRGATIGGGASSDLNRVTDDYGTVGGGAGNQAGDGSGISFDTAYATVGGGLDNTASGDYATIGGGGGNTASGERATVGGGDDNIASGNDSSIGGGYENIASGYNATIGGGGRNTASNSHATVAGGYRNAVTGTFATIGGGYSSVVTGTFATIAGGWDNVANGWVTTVGGGSENTATGNYATVAGGVGNTASGDRTAIGGGGGNTASGSWCATIAGGDENTASGSLSTIGGGYHNNAEDNYTIIGGGYENHTEGNYATIAGGYENHTEGDYATIAGGYDHYAGGDYATIIGGYDHHVGGDYATVGGGYNNYAVGDYSFAAGRRANAVADGCFAWGDSTDSNLNCNNPNRFMVRASGGVYLYTKPDISTGAYLAPGGSSWNVVSDRQRKENLMPVDTQELLARLIEIPITTWNYQAQDPSIRHVGPMAQDFNTLLPGLGGEGEEYINTLDANGVALAAIQGLHAKNQALEAEVSMLKTKNATLKKDLNNLEARVTALERAGTPQPVSTLAIWWPLAGLVVLAGAVVAQRRGQEVKR